MNMGKWSRSKALELNMDLVQHNKDSLIDGLSFLCKKSKITILIIET